MGKRDKAVVRAVMRDRERMSFIDKHGFGIVKNYHFVMPRATLRRAIDNAMLEYSQSKSVREGANERDAAP